MNQLQNCCQGFLRRIGSSGALGEGMRLGSESPSGVSKIRVSKMEAHYAQHVGRALIGRENPPDRFGGYLQQICVGVTFARTHVKRLTVLADLALTFSMWVTRQASATEISSNR